MNHAGSAGAFLGAECAARRSEMRRRSICRVAAERDERDRPLVPMGSCLRLEGDSSRRPNLLFSQPRDRPTARRSTRAAAPRRSPRRTSGVAINAVQVPRCPRACVSAGHGWISGCKQPLRQPLNAIGRRSEPATAIDPANRLRPKVRATNDFHQKGSANSRKHERFDVEVAPSWSSRGFCAAYNDAGGVNMLLIEDLSRGFRRARCERRFLASPRRSRCPGQKRSRTDMRPTCLSTKRCTSGRRCRTGA